jgi:hypothetical protein
MTPSNRANPMGVGGRIEWQIGRKRKRAVPLFAPIAVRLPAVLSVQWWKRTTLALLRFSTSAKVVVGSIRQKG